ncbi:hypothetical protein P8452_64230 [Trifolium repens]|nr:hypothetical protein P8452_64230 [Trifolium repens]
MVKIVEFVFALIITLSLFLIATSIKLKPGLGPECIYDGDCKPVIERRLEKRLSSQVQASSFFFQYLRCVLQ